MSQLPHFMIIGAMKSATSTLHDQLVQQPGIFMCEPKEPNFFSDDGQYDRGIKWYENLFNSFPENALLGEASTHYTKLPTYPETVNRINTHCPDAKFIYVMRHPVDRLVSHYIHEWSMGIYKCDVNEAITKHPEMVNYSLYSMQLEPYIKQFGKDRILPVFFDRLLQYSQSELERICDFIGYTGTPSWHSDAKPKNVSRQRIRKFPLYNLLVDSSVAEFIRRAIVPVSIRNKIKLKLQMQDRPALNDTSKKHLAEIFDEDLARLGDMLGVEINNKNFKIITAENILDWRGE